MMDANDIVKRYTSGERDFRGANLAKANLICLPVFSIVISLKKAILSLNDFPGSDSRYS